MGLFSKSKKVEDSPFEEKKLPKAEQIFYDSVETDDDTYLTSLADKIKNGQPIILNLAPLDIDQANKIIAFLSGVVYALSGDIVNIKEHVFMFAGKDVYDDGSMEEFLKGIVE
ncbi:MAG: cell division protein SepF [Acholeplasmataceae bacterium]|jgi:cell division inhibitor SepF|nr:cell division protein SepF [Acholeplasmataceae bacterium]MDD4194374.1 cell division protein SepF [Acholeplasmataceae bacterium]MDY0339003.1 cell division protein SepF [Acholeplasmataceae bacterium]